MNNFYWWFLIYVGCFWKSEENSLKFSSLYFFLVVNLIVFFYNIGLVNKIFMVFFSLSMFFQVWLEFKSFYSSFSFKSFFSFFLFDAVFILGVGVYPLVIFYSEFVSLNYLNCFLAYSHLFVHMSDSFILESFLFLLFLNTFEVTFLKWFVFR